MYEKRNQQEAANLQVLSVLERDIITSTKDEESRIKGVKYWILYEGTGTYTVNLQVIEFIVDQERHEVFARIPRPELDISYGDRDVKLCTQVGLLNGSSKEGKEITNNASVRAQNSIREKIENTILIMKSYFFS